MKSKRNDASPRLRSLPGVRVGHASDFKGLTGCTVVLAEGGAVCGVDVRGSAAGTRELAPCQPGHLVDRVNAIFLTGGSAFGLDAAAGVMQYLESRGVGFPAGRSRIPIVPGAVIFDLSVGSAKARPNVQMALKACRNATDRIVEGSVGAGTGATVGKLFGLARAMKGGIGFHSLRLGGAAVVQAIVVVNALGDVVDPASGCIIAGARSAPRSNRLARSTEQMFKGKIRRAFGTANTTLAVIMTNARLDKVQATKVAQMAQDGIARAISPAHTLFDGDVVFALSLGSKCAELSALGAASAEAISIAIVRAVRAAGTVGRMPQFSGGTRR